MNPMDFDGKRHSCLCLGKLPIQWQHHHSNVPSISDSCIVLFPHLLHCIVICYADRWQRMLVMKIGRIIMAMEMATDQGSTDTLWMGSHTRGTIRFIKINQSWITTKQIHFFHPIALIVFSYLDCRKRFKKTKLFQYFQKLGRSSSPNMVRFSLLPHMEFGPKISHQIFQELREYFYSWIGERRNRQETQQLLMNHPRAQKLQSKGLIRWISMDMESYQSSKPYPIKRILSLKSWWVSQKILEAYFYKKNL